MFHLALIGAAKNPILSCIDRSRYLMTRSARYAYFEVAGSGAQSIKEQVRTRQARKMPYSLCLTLARWKGHLSVSAQLPHFPDLAGCDSIREGPNVVHDNDY
jgi:hypothetical protein